jgi:hypothetical protein
MRQQITSFTRLSDGTWGVRCPVTDAVTCPREGDAHMVIRRDGTARSITLGELVSTSPASATFRIAV